MDNLTKWSYRVGLFSALCMTIGALCLALLDVIAPTESAGNRVVPEAVVGAFAAAFILLGFIVFFGALRKLREVWGPLTARTKLILIGALIATNFFGGYIFFMIYPRIRLRS